MTLLNGPLPLDDAAKQHYLVRRESVFLIIASVFLGSLAMMNILGISRFIDLSFTLFDFSFPMILPIGILPYPITFLCTDLVSELYGAKRAYFLVLGGLIVNIWVYLVLWLAGLLPSSEIISLDTGLPSVHHPEFAFYQIRMYAMGSLVGSMLAYICAQFLDIYLYHFWEKVTKGKHLWLRNNASTIVSQFLDTVIVIMASYMLVEGFPIEQGNVFQQLWSIIFACYLFKFIAALLDTLPFYLLIVFLRSYLGLNQNITHIKESKLAL